MGCSGSTEKQQPKAIDKPKPAEHAQQPAPVPTLPSEQEGCSTTNDGASTEGDGGAHAQHVDPATADVAELKAVDGCGTAKTTSPAADSVDTAARNVETNGADSPPASTCKAERGEVVVEEAVDSSNQQSVSAAAAQPTLTPPKRETQQPATNGAPNLQKKKSSKGAAQMKSQPLEKKDEPALHKKKSSKGAAQMKNETREAVQQPQTPPPADKSAAGNKKAKNQAKAVKDAIADKHKHQKDHCAKRDNVHPIVKKEAPLAKRQGGDDYDAAMPTYEALLKAADEPEELPRKKVLFDSETMRKTAPKTINMNNLSKKQKEMIKQNHVSTGRRGPVSSKRERGSKSHMQTDKYLAMAAAFERLLTNAETINAQLDTR